MTTFIAARPAGPPSGGTARALRPTFLGVARGEFFKLARQRLNRVLVAGIVVVTLGPYLYALAYNAASAANHRQIVNGLVDQPPLLIPLYFLGLALALQRVVIGIFLLIATARMVGLDYQNGTIRVLLARGVGRLQLLAAKLTVIALVGIVLLALGIVLNLIGTLVIVRIVAGNLDPLGGLTSQYWAAARIELFTVLLSMGISILLATAVTVVTRSLSFGLAGALGWFAADNILVGLLGIISGFTNGNVFPLQLSAYLLGPDLNAMPGTMVPAVTVSGRMGGHLVSTAVSVPGLGIMPLVQYDGRHALVVALVYAAIFAAAAMVVIWRRDVME